MPEKTNTPDEQTQFSDQAQQTQAGIVREFADFLLHNKKWWITPIVIVLLAVGALVLVSGTVVAPFIYTLF